MRIRTILASAIAVLALSTVSYAAQNDPAPQPNSSLFTASSEAVAFHHAGSWSAATHIIQSFDLIDFGKTKANPLFVEGHQLMAPTPGINAYMGGVKFVPNISKVIARTNIPAGSFAVFISGAGGVATYSGSNVNSTVFSFGGGAQYKMTGQLSWNAMHANWIRIGSQNDIELSTGLQFIFAKK